MKSSNQPVTETARVRPLEPSEILHWVQTKNRASTASWLSIAAGFTLLVSGCGRGDLGKLMSVSGALACGVAARLCRETTIETSRVTQDFEDISTANRQNIIWEQTRPQLITHEKPIIEPEKSKKPKLFDFSRLSKEPDKFPHVLVYGSTGDGKTLTTEWLMSELGGLKLAVTPHQKPTDFPGMPVYGGGRNYGALTDKRGNPLEDVREFSLEELLNPGDRWLSAEQPPTIAEVVLAVYLEMTRRFELYSQGITKFDPVNVVIDESRSVLMKALGVAGLILDILAEARKVGIRLFMLTQSDRVKALKFEGQGDMRECLTYLRLGDFAKSQAQELFEAGLVTEESLKWLRGQSRPCMVDDELAEIPDLSDFDKQRFQGVQQPTDKQPTDNRQESDSLLKNVRIPENSIDYELLEKTKIIYELAQKHKQLKASGLKQLSWKFREMTPDQIRELFDVTVDIWGGYVVGDGKSKVYQVETPVDVTTNGSSKTD